ncbi:hypothetical protein Tco_1551313, partial [Tanacetum coccineum]
QTHNSHASSLGADKGTGNIIGVPDVPTYKSDDEQISWKSTEEEDDDEVNVSKDNYDDADNDDDVDKDDEDDDADNQDDEIPDDDDEQTNSDNDGDNFVHPKLTTHDDEARHDDEVNEEGSDEENHDESNEDNDEEVQSANTEEEEMDEKATHEEDEVNELYKDVDINLEGRDTVMTDAPLPNVQGTQVMKDTHVIITASINPEGQQQSSSVSSGFVSNMLNPSQVTGIDTIFTPNNEATSLVDVPVTTIAEPPLLSTRTLPPTPLITYLQQTPVPLPATVPSSSLQDLPNYGSLFRFDHRLETLETDFFGSSKLINLLKQFLPFSALLMLLIRSSNDAKTSHAIAANLPELEMKKILIDKMEANKSIDRSDIQKNLYKVLVDAYNTDKDIMDAYETLSLSNNVEMMQMMMKNP